MIFVLSLLPFLAQARAIDTIHKARKVKSQIEKSVLEIPGVNGIGITGCDPRTGVQNIDRDFVYCVGITTETKAAQRAVERMYPKGMKFRGVFVTVRHIGKIVAQPRLSAGR